MKPSPDNQLDAYMAEAYIASDMSLLMDNIKCNELDVDAVEVKQFLLALSWSI